MTRLPLMYIVPFQVKEAPFGGGVESGALPAMMISFLRGAAAAAATVIAVTSVVALALAQSTGAESKRVRDHSGNTARSRPSARRKGCLSRYVGH
jgi:hypothetical protein